jgi:arylsulfatase A-like enzyme
LRDGKGTLYEGGMRVPLIWRWPNHIAAGKTNDRVVAHIDVYPTLLALLGLPMPPQQQVDGESYAPLLTGNGDFSREALFNYFPHGPSPGRAGGVWVRSGPWKLIRWFGLPEDDAARLELYNLDDDAGETHNLAAAEPQQAARLDGLITRFLDRTAAAYPRPNPNYRASAAR